MISGARDVHWTASGAPLYLSYFKPLVTQPMATRAGPQGEIFSLTRVMDSFEAIDVGQHFRHGTIELLGNKIADLGRAIKRSG